MKDRLSGKDIAKLDAERYDEPGRDLLATKPAEDGVGDVQNERAESKVPGSMGSAEDEIGSDERARLAKGKNA